MKLKYVLMFIACSVFAAFPTHSNTSSIDISKITGNYDSFVWDWCNRDSQTISLTINSSGTGVDLTGYNVKFKLEQKTESGKVEYFTTTNITIAASNLSFSVAYTNIPDDGKYLAEAFVWEGSSTNASRTVAQGKIIVFNSLYSE